MYFILQLKKYTLKKKRKTCKDCHPWPLKYHSSPSKSRLLRQTLISSSLSILDPMFLLLLSPKHFSTPVFLTTVLTGLEHLVQGQIQVPFFLQGLLWSFFQILFTHDLREVSVKALHCSVTVNFYLQLKSIHPTPPLQL